MSWADGLAAIWRNNEMREALIDIREKLQEGIYLNEEHVRLSLVCRLLSELDWEIWDPAEVNTEFPPIPTEDKTRVDIALFANTHISHGVHLMSRGAHLCHIMM